MLCCVLQRCVMCLHRSCQISGFHILVFLWSQVYKTAHGCQHISKDSTHRWRRTLWTPSLSSHAMESGLWGCVWTESFRCFHRCFSSLKGFEEAPFANPGVKWINYAMQKGHVRHFELVFILLFFHSTQ